MENIYSNIYSTLSNILIKTQDHVTQIRQRKEPRAILLFLLFLFLEAQGGVSESEDQGRALMMTIT